MAGNPAIDDRAILALHEAGKSTRAIAEIAGHAPGEITGLSKTSIARRLKHLNPRKSTEIYKEFKADIIAEKQRKILMRAGQCSPKEERDLAVAWGIYADKENILRGLNPESRPMIIVNEIKINTESGENDRRPPVDNSVDTKTVIDIK